MPDSTWYLLAVPLAVIALLLLDPHLPGRKKEDDRG